MRCPHLLALLFIISSTCFGQAGGYPNFDVGRLGIAQGLSNNSVRCIYQDHNGFIWFGTYDGLNRYDGYGFKVFRNKLNDSTSLPHNYVYAIHEDRNNKLWVGTGQGLAMYNRLNSTFLPVYFKLFETGDKRRTSFTINAIESDSLSNIFIGTNGWGLLAKNENTAIATQVPLKTNRQILTGYNVTTLSVDKQQRIWLFIAGTGLCEFDKTTMSIRVINNTLPAATSIKPGSDGHLWIGSGSGVYLYSISANEVIRHYKAAPGMLSENHVVSLWTDQKNQLWIGTEGGGVNILDIASEKFRYLLPGEEKRNLSSESVFAIMADRESRMWLGTLKGGINIIDWHKSRFRTYTHNPLNPNSLVNNFVSAFHEKDSTQLWIGTDGGGISVWNHAKNQFQNFRHDPSNKRSLSHNSISCIIQDYLGDTWIATFGGGVNRFNSTTKNFERFSCINSQNNEENKQVWLLFEDMGRNFWATTFGSGKLYLLNRQLNRFEVFDPILNDLIAFTEDHTGTLWAGNSHELVRIDKKTRKHVFYEIGKPVRAIYEDTKNRLWIGSEGGGLILFDTKKGEIQERYSVTDGLCNNAVLNILEDKEGYLWLSTFNGLSKFKYAARKFRNFYQSDGLQSNQFSYNAALKLRSGKLAFGGIGGFNLFNPGNIKPRNYMPAVYFTDISINNKPLSSAGAYITKFDKERIAELQIPYNDATFSFTYTALEYTSSEKINYAYYLEGWDKDWNYSGNTRTINYNNISEGTYTLRVKATNAEGEWNNQEARISIIILPPWYRTWWMYSLYVILGVLSIYLINKYKKRQEQLKYQVKVEKINAINERERAEKEHLIAQQEREIAENHKMIAENERQISEKEKEIAAKEREINEKRVSFFTNIAHEFRSPLTLIINPVEDLLKKNETSEETRDLKIIERNSKRLLSLVNQLMLFRKAESEVGKLTISPVDLTKICREVYLSFTHEAEAKKINYHFECTDPGLTIYGDPEKIEIILYNLISNALKYTPREGSVSVCVSNAGDRVELLVKDTGYGFDKEVGDRIFDKFYRAEGSDITSKPGFGIGLYLVKNFTQLHHGTINHSSIPGEGSSFLLHFLKGKDHFSLNDGIVIEDVMIPEVQPAIKTFQVQTDEVPEPVSLSPLVTDKRTMLVIDDNDEIRNYMLDIFREEFIVYEASDGAKGLELASTHIPDIVVSDIMMPGITGIEACKAIKSNEALAHIPVLLLTGTGSQEVQLKGAEGGADDYLTKPFSKELLVARVITLLKNRTQVQQYFYDEVTQKMNSSKISAEDKAFLERCVAAIEGRMDEDQFGIELLARDLGMSDSNLLKKVKKVAGYSTNGFIRFVRLRKAARLLIDTDRNVNEVAFEVGIQDVKYFRENFNKQFGMNPSDFIKKYRKPFSRGFQMVGK